MLLRILLLPMLALASTPVRAAFPLDECPLADENWIFCTSFEDGTWSGLKAEYR